MSDELDALYQEEILDHYKSPRNYGVLKNANAHAHDSNPLCGDVLDVDLMVDSKNIIADVRFRGEGCAISKASASMLGEELKGKPLEYAKKLSREEWVERLGVPLSPSRRKCALLSLKVFKLAAYGFSNEKLVDDPMA